MTRNAGVVMDEEATVAASAASLTDVVAVAEHAALFLQASLSGLKNERLDEAVVAEATVRDIVMHLAIWEAEFLREVTAASRRSGTSFTPTFEPGSACGPCLMAGGSTAIAWERGEIEKRRGGSPGQVFLELEQTQHRLLGLVRALNDRRLRHVARWPWGRESTLGELIVLGASHKRAHAELIREWRTARHF